MEFESIVFIILGTLLLGGVIVCAYFGKDYLRYHKVFAPVLEILCSCIKGISGMMPNNASLMILSTVLNAAVEATEMARAIYYNASLRSLVVTNNNGSGEISENQEPNGNQGDINNSEKTIYITSYDSLRNDLENYTIQRKTLLSMYYKCGQFYQEEQNPNKRIYINAKMILPSCCKLVPLVFLHFLLSGIS